MSLQTFVAAGFARLVDAINAVDVKASSAGGGTIPIVTSDPASPATEDMWVLETSESQVRQLGFFGAMPIMSEAEVVVTHVLKVRTASGTKSLELT
jgi:hypothetical protein